ncbi:twitching motility protein PilT [Skermanella aerolata]|uniref:Twitching motility protein PilT n=1 Tax=Skermanella aerolata TaxID=393310 RepID=A0A512DTR8_9PROT|nr:type II toxin-antitoxin system VapC family toxin [Skermanella aerolata]KJB92076.1 pilus assembly protein CpaF [Skermanella aerolata KACC 11604]GEO39861.1 twitching motility protein PilT [Skermanella aerolata]
MYLLDTVVLSEFRKRNRDIGVLTWIRSVAPSDLFISVVTIGEIELGIEKQREIDTRFAEELSRWLDTTLRIYSNQILGMDIGVAKRWGRLAARIGNRGMDLAIAATALESGLTVVTRNVSDFAPTGVAMLDPFSGVRQA